MKAEIIQASVDKNGTLAEITTAGPKIAEIPILYDASLEEPAMGYNSLNVSVPGPGDYLLLLEMSYNSTSPSSLVKPLNLLYESVLVAK